MTHLQDTNSCVDHLRRGPASNVTAKLATAVPGRIVLCSVVAAELLYGAHRSIRQAQKDLGIADGQEVQVQVTIVPPARKCGEGILRTAGAWVDYPELDAIMEKIHLGRKGDMS